MAFYYLNYLCILGIIGMCMSSEDSVVLLKADYRDGNLTLTCKVDTLVFAIVIRNPEGETVGSCLAPVRTTPLQQGTCSTPHIVQHLDTNKTIFTIDHPENIDNEGFWECHHGTQRGNDSVYIHVQGYLTRDTHLHQKDQSCECWIGGIVSAVVTFGVTFGMMHLNRELSLWRRLSRRILKGLQRFINILRRNENSEDSIETQPIFPKDRTTGNKPKFGKCCYCKNQTSYSVCGDCQGSSFCETCADNHITNHKNHHIIQIMHFPVKHKTKCYRCNKEIPKIICKKCINGLLCSECLKDCPHSHDANMVKRLVTPESDATDTFVSVNTENQSEILHEKFSVNVSSRNKAETRIRGIAFLDNGQFVLADFKTRQLKIFSSTKLDFSKPLKMEPRGLTGIQGNKVGVTFAYEKKIILYQVKRFDALKYDEFDFKDIGKPFEIAFDEDHYVVEVDEGEDGRLVILDKNGNTLHVISNDHWKYGYFTGNTIRLQLDVSKGKLYVAAIGKKTIYCLDFLGNIDWHVQISSPRSMAVVRNTINTTLLVTSNQASMIYKLICEKKSNDEEYDKTLIPLAKGDDIKLPGYIAYDNKRQILYTEVENGYVNIYQMASLETNNSQNP